MCSHSTAAWFPAEKLGFSRLMEAFGVSALSGTRPSHGNRARLGLSRDCVARAHNDSLPVWAMIYLLVFGLEPSPE